MERKKIILSIGILIILIFLFLGYNYYNSDYQRLRRLSYSKEAVKLIINHKIDKYILRENVYSKTLEVALLDGEYESDNLGLYVYFEYKNQDKYIDHLNKLRKMGYKNDEINIIFDHLNSNDIDKIVNRTTVINNLASYVSEEYFKINNLDRYVVYKNNNPLYDYEKVIDYVNMDLDYDFYTNITTIENPDNILVLVNKYHQLSSNFVPKDLTSISSKYSTSSEIKVIPVVKGAFEEMCADMESIGLTVKAISTYRSYNTQTNLYNSYVKRDGKEIADTYSARPGHSEHQTGLALDVYNGILSYTSFDNTSEYLWLVNNAYKYGFIIRYPKDKENITGYMYEPWHLRYVGKDVSAYIYQHNITFDEYHMRYLEDKN